jgi:hypothetical protein
MALSRRRFVGSIAAALGYAGVAPEVDLFAQRQGRAGGPGGARGPRPSVDLSKVAKINNNENPYGVPAVVRDAMEDPKAWEWANRYGAPDGGLNQALQDLHGVKAENIILGCGSGELLSSITHRAPHRRPEEEGAGRQPDLQRSVREGVADAPPLGLSRVLGGPKWIDSARYDINAKASAAFRTPADGPGPSNAAGRHRRGSPSSLRRVVRCAALPASSQAESPCRSSPRS